jgi:chaperone modulatory protein CbpM
VKHDIIDAIRLEESAALSCSELASLSGLSETEVRELVDYGALEGYVVRSTHLTFTSASVTLARTARRLRNDFELETHALALVVKFGRRIDELQAELDELRARVPSGGR